MSSQSGQRYTPEIASVGWVTQIMEARVVLGVMEDERMPKLNLTRDGPKLTVSDLHLMKQVEAANLERATRLRKARFGNRIFGSLLATLAVSIYAYSMYAVKQEKFLDDFDEPEKVSDQQ